MKKAVSLFLMIITFSALSSCTKEKAEAIKIGAEVFRQDAVSALSDMNSLFLRNISVVKLTNEEEVNKILKDLMELDPNENVNSEILGFWSEEAVLGESAQSLISKEFEALKAQYYSFESIFTSLDKGSYFAKDAVKNAEKHAINLTLQLINFSRLIEENEFTNASKRVLIIEQMNAANKETNQEVRKTKLRIIAREFTQLRLEEKDQKEHAIRACLKSAESGYLVAELIKDYDKMKVSDILSTIKSSMNFASVITNGNQDINDLISKFENVESTIKNDPYWKVLLDQNVYK